MEPQEVFDNIVATKELDVPVDVTVGETRYLGTFKVRIPTVKDEIAIRVKETELRGGQDIKNFDDVTLVLIRAFAVMSTLVTQKPEWCKNVEELPAEVVINFFTQYMEKADFFQRK